MEVAHVPPGRPSRTQGCSGAGTRGKAFPHIFHALLLIWVGSCFKLAILWMRSYTFFVSTTSLVEGYGNILNFTGKSLIEIIIGIKQCHWCRCLVHFISISNSKRILDYINYTVLNPIGRSLKPPLLLNTNFSTPAFSQCACWLYL